MIRRFIFCDTCDAKEELERINDIPKNWRHIGQDKHVCPECTKTAELYDEFKKKQPDKIAGRPIQGSGI
jgi:hypothetical protein